MIRKIPKGNKKTRIVQNVIKFFLKLCSTIIISTANSFLDKGYHKKYDQCRFNDTNKTSFSFDASQNDHSLSSSYSLYEENVSKAIGGLSLSDDNKRVVHSSHLTVTLR